MPYYQEDQFLNPQLVLRSSNILIEYLPMSSFVIGVQNYTVFKINEQ